MAAVLARAGSAVTVMARPQSATALIDREKVEVSGQLTFTVTAGAVPAHPGHIGVVDRGSGLPEADAVLFTTKGQDLPASIDEVASAWPHRHRDSAFVAGLQNGVVKDELLARAFGAANVVGAATVLGSRRTAPGSVSISGLGTTFLGEFDAGTSSRTEAMAATFVGAGLPCLVVPDVRALLWTKFCNAIGIFGVSALTGLPSVEIFARRPLALAYRSLIEEAAAVADAEGAPVANFPDLPIRSYLEGQPEDAADAMTRRARPSGGPPGFSSMAQDLAAGRQTEVHETFGDLLCRARTHGLDLPRSELAYRLLAGL
jgi:2-dehydropantoate 2-reductase